MKNQSPNKYYTGIGSRETPLSVLLTMVKFANIMEKKGFILRSGSAEGADYAFEAGVKNTENEEIYIPNEKFGYFKHKLKTPKYIIPSKDNEEAFKKANKLLSVNNLHPFWNKNMKDYTRLLHNRNMFQVLGFNCEDNPMLSVKSKFILCYTSDKSVKASDTSVEKTGGTGTAIRAGDLYNIEVFNLSRADHLKRITNFVNDNDYLIDYNYIQNIILKTKYNKDMKSLIELFPEKFNCVIEHSKQEKPSNTTQIQQRKPK